MIDLKNFPPAMGNYLVLKSGRIAGLSKEQEFCHWLPQPKVNRPGTPQHWLHDSHFNCWCARSCSGQSLDPGGPNQLGSAPSPQFTSWWNKYQWSTQKGDSTWLHCEEEQGLLKSFFGALWWSLGLNRRQEVYGWLGILSGSPFSCEVVPQMTRTVWNLLLETRVPSGASLFTKHFWLWE